VAFYRGQLVGRLRANTVNPGAMISANLPMGDVSSYLERCGLSHCAQKIQIACINSPTNVTLSGDEEAIDALKRQLDEDGLFSRKLSTGVAYHSSAMDPVGAEYSSLMYPLEAADQSQRKPITIASSVTGTVVPPEQLSTPSYWTANLTSPVNFVGALSALVQDHVGARDFVEVGPSPALRRPVLDTIGQYAKYNSGTETMYSSVLSKSKTPVRSFLELIGSLFCRGYRVSMAEQQEETETGASPAFLVDCPAYPFDKSTRYWAESRLSRDFRLRESTRSSMLGSRVSDWNPLEPRWTNSWSAQTPPWTADHEVSCPSYS
jgi:acyl transferase domain-containing protein